MKFDFWDNYQNMLKVIVWKQNFIKPIWCSSAVPLKIIRFKLRNSDTWALMCRVNGEIDFDNIEVDYSKRGTSLNKKAMENLVIFFWNWVSSKADSVVS